MLPLTLIEPRLTRAQIVLHASQQFLEGDVLKWWHRAPNGGTGLGQRTKASDPHLWLPYVLARYVRETRRRERARRGHALPRSASPCPSNQETWIVIPRASRETATVYEHARLAIDFTLEHLGDERSSAAAGRRLERRHRRARARREIGTSVWMGFFLANVLDGFAPIARSKGDEAFADACEEALAGQRAALDVGWRGDHYALDFADDGEVLDAAERHDYRLGGLFRRLRRRPRARRDRRRPEGDRAA